MPQPLSIPPSQGSLIERNIVRPGNKGLNTMTSGGILDQSYALDTKNAVIDVAGRLAARNGVVNQTTVPISGTPAVKSIWEYNQGGGGVYKTIIAYNGGISNSVTSPVANDISGAVVDANGRWFFQNFNNKCIGLQAGQTPIVYNGTGNFANVTVSAGSAPTGGIGCAAFGRLWVVDSDGQTIKYTGLLDETDWGSSDAGVIDMHTVWVNGTDRVTAIFAWNASLVICGLEHIIFYTDGRGSQLGVDPTQMYVFDVLTGTGCNSQWTVAPVGESDMLMLTQNGVQSLGRLQQARNNPIATVTKYIRNTFLAQMSGEVLANITGEYNQLNGFYLVSFPVAGVVWCLDTRIPYIDEFNDDCFVCTYWNMTATALMSDHNQNLYIARTAGQVALYGQFSDEGTSYSFTWLSPWTPLDDSIATRLKLLKRLRYIIYTGGANSASLSWNTDFGATQNAVNYSLPAAGVIAQYGISQYGIDQYSGGAGLSAFFYDARASGQFYQLGFSTTTLGTVALQMIQLDAKVGRAT